MTKNALATTLAVTAALLAGPTAARAATVGSDLDKAPSTTIACDERCTLAWGAEGWFERPLPEGEIVTSWRAHLAPGTRARLRVLRRNADFSWTAVAASDAVTGSPGGGVQAFPVHLPVAGRSHFIAVDVEHGGLGAVDQDEMSAAPFRPALGDDETRSTYRTRHELLLQATTEGDADADGKGDVTEDDCVFCSPPAAGGGSAGDAGGAGPGTPSPPPAQEVLPSPSPGTGSSPGAAERPTAFAVDRRALLRAGAHGRQGWADLYVKNDSVGTLDAKLVVKAGKRRVASATVKELESGDATDVAVKLGARERKAPTLANGYKHVVRQPLTVLAGGDRRYDGTYRGPGPFVMVVERGTIRTISSMVLAYCVETKRRIKLNIFTTDGFPALVGRDGRFDVTGGSAGGQSNTYRGRLTRKGTGKGYASAFRSSLMTSGGRYMVEGCTGATNWTVRRDR